MLYKITVRSTIDYGLQIYYHSLKLTEKERYERIQYSAARLVTDTLQTTSKFKLFEELGWETISDRADYLGITLFHKVHRNECRPMIKRVCLNLTQVQVKPGLGLSTYHTNTKTKIPHTGDTESLDRCGS